MAVATVSPLEQIIIRKLDISEYDGNKRFIAGYANIAGIRDSQGEVVTQEGLKAAWNKWRQNPDFCILSLGHTNLPMAKVVFESVTDSNGRTYQSGVDERGLYIVAQVRDDVSIADELWSDIEAGNQRGYSIGGRNLDPQSPECKDDVCTRFITNLELYEVAIVDHPANKWSIFNVLKQDDLAKLAEVTNRIPETILTEGAVKISKRPCPDSGHYHVLIRDGLELGDMFSDEQFSIITEPVEGEEYINLFDIALLRPHGALTGEARHGGVNPPPLTAETPDTLKTEGENPLKEETIEEVIEETKDESPKDDSESSETAETVEEVAEEALAPLTIETLAADLALLLDLFDRHVDKAVWTTAYVNDLPDSAFAYIEPGGSKDEGGKTKPRSLRHLPYKDKGGKPDAAHVRNALARLPQTHISDKAKASAKGKLCSAARSVGIESDVCRKTEKVVKSVEEAAEEQPEVKSAEEAKVDKIVQVVQENIEAPPLQPEVTEAKLEEAKTLPKPTVEPESEPKPLKEEKIETRGVATQVKEEQTAFDIAAFRRLSWKEIHEAMEEN